MCFIDFLVFRSQGDRKRTQQELVTLLSNPLHTLLPPGVRFDKFVKVCDWMAVNTPWDVCVHFVFVQCCLTSVSSSFLSPSLFTLSLLVCPLFVVVVFLSRSVSPSLSSAPAPTPVSYTHLRAHDTAKDLVCRLLLEKNFFNDTATTEIYTTAIVGSVRCV